MDLELSPDDNDLIIDSDCNQDELDFGLLDEKDDEDTEKNVAVPKPSILSDLVRQPNAPAKRPSLQPLQAQAGAGGLPFKDSRLSSKLRLVHFNHPRASNRQPSAFIGDQSMFIYLMKCYDP